MINNNFKNDTLRIFSSLTNKEKKFFKRKKILIIGSNGFIGRYFVYFFNYLISLNYSLEIDCYDNGISSATLKNELNNFKSKSIKFNKADINKLKFKKNYDIILFLAGIATPTIYKKYPIETLDTSFKGLKNCLESIKNKKTNFVYFSSSEIYGNPDSKNIPTKESYYGNVNSFGPRSCYDEGKRIGETLCYVYYKKYKSNIKVIRPFNVFGPGMSKEDTRVIPSIVKSLRKNKNITIFNNGKQTRTFCYVTDAINGFLKTLINGKKGEIYNIGNEKNEISMNDLAKKIKQSFQNQSKIINSDYPATYPGNEPQRRCPDISKARKKLGFRPKVNIDQSLDLFIKYYIS